MGYFFTFPLTVPLQQQAGALEVVVATRHGAGPGAQALGELLNHRVVGHGASALLVRRFSQKRKVGLGVCEDQQVTVFTVLVMPGDALFGAQALQELKISLGVLRAVFTHRAVVDVEGVSICLDAMAPKHLGQHLRHAQVLENARVLAELQIVQGGYKADAMTRQALAGFPDVYLFDMAVEPFAFMAEL